jgi:uncharacterized protein YndB with AHSA1/START domain
MYSATIDIPASPSKVFAALTDPKLAKQWQPEAVEVKLPDGGLRVGAVTTVLVEEFGRRFSVEFVVVALEPDVKIAYDATTPMWSGHIEYVLAHRTGGTNVSFTFVPNPPKRIPFHIARALAMLTRPLMQRRFQSRLAALRRVVEANA